jgi:glycine dehydrogenase subunit 1
MPGRFFNEFTIRTAQAGKDVRHALAERGIHAGVPVPEHYGLGHAIILAATELTRDEDIRALTDALAQLTLLEAAHD